MESKVYSKEFFKYVVKDGKASICSYRGFKKVLTIPESLGGYIVASIGEMAFWGCKKLVEVVIPNSVVSIGTEAFSGCKSLVEVVIPDSVTHIENWGFFRCKSLAEVIIPNSVTRIGGNAFTGCKGLADVVIPRSVTSIGKGAFDRGVVIVGVEGSYVHDYAIAERLGFRVG